MSSKTFVIDTNVLLHDPTAISRFENHQVVLPLVVLEELDGFKRRSDELGRNAREVLAYIDSLKHHDKGDLSKGVVIPEGPTVRISFDHRSDKIKTFPLPLDRTVNRILLMAHQLQNLGETVTFVSRDFVSRVKAQAINLSTEDYQVPNENYDHVYRGIQKLDVDKKIIDHFFKDGEVAIPNAKFTANEYCLLNGGENTSAVGRYNLGLKKLETLEPFERDIWGILPLNVEQRCAIDLLLRDDVNLVTMIGPAGTGKTLMALACGMKKTFDDNTYSRILISRPIVPLGKDIGYLPGTKEEKLSHWMQPIFDNLDLLCENMSGEGNGPSTLEWIQDCNRIEMEAVTYIRGRSLPKMFIIIDEAQNLTPHEMKTVISRAGKGTKIVLTGDPTQIDNPYLDQHSNGLTYTMQRFKNQKLFGHILLDKTERSELASLAVKIM